MPSINTQSIQDANDKIHDNLIKGLSNARSAVLERAEKIGGDSSTIAANRSKAVAFVGSGFDLIEKVLDKQHDLTGNLLAKTR